jgi:DMSO/TMAO reductase YedYZ molybdopterin-dependent catalytic subunit
MDLATYRLEVTGLVENPLSLTYDEIRCLPRMSGSPILVCPGFFEDQAEWAGASLASILDRAGVAEGGTRVRIAGADRYTAIVTLDNARSTGAFLAYEWEGEPLPILHGFPVRAVFPTLPGNKWVKWVVEIEVY